MNAHQLSESLLGTSSLHLSNGTQNGKEISVRLEKDISNSLIKSENGQYQKWRSGHSPDSEWRTTTDTSIYSSPSPSPVSLEVLEACDGMDNMTLETSTISPVMPIKAGRGRGRGRGRNRGRGNGRVTSKKNSYKKAPVPESSSSSYDSDSSTSASDSNSNSNCSSDSSNSCSCNSSESCSDCCRYSSCQSSYTSSSSSYTSSSTCSCCESTTSYESADDLTSLPRAKRGSKLGPVGSKKVADKCSQS
uniref:Uncharacterized protein n=1 Tax=Homalodisca liturata TaxID=320908 RepID=A0A1B6HTU5_9HEMI